MKNIKKFLTQLICFKSNIVIKTSTIMKKYLFYMMLLVISFTSTIKLSAQTVVTNPTSPWTVPAGVTSVKVEVWGGGGGGGGAYWGSGGGGGGGAYKTGILTVSAGQTYTITIGAGGTVGSNANGNTGGVTTFTGTGGTVTANGGTGGNRGNIANGTGGTGGTGGTYDGGDGGTSSGNGVGGGGGAGNNAIGGDGGNAATGTGGAGNPNASPYIGGNGGAYITSNANGNAGNVPGGGGGGARSASSTTSRSGGVGGAGQVVITYTVCISPTIYNVTGGGSYCSGGSGVSINLSNSESGVNYELYKNLAATGTILPGTGSNLIFSGVTAAGSYTVVATRTSGGCTSNMSGSATVTIISLPTAPTSENTVICTGSTSNLTASGAVSGDKYKWYDAASGGNLLKTSTNNTDNTFTTPALTSTTNYWVSIISSTGCEGALTQVTVTVSNPVSSVNSHTDISCYAGSNGTITIQASGGISPYQFSVDNGDTYTTGSNPNPYAYSGLVANIEYKIRVKDSIGCQSIAIP
jgi:hypothetical protein